MATKEHEAWTMRETAHYNGGKEWFGYKYQCIEQPRLSRKDRYTRKDRSVSSVWLVDGEECATFGAALEILESPPALTVPELDIVAAFTAVTMEKRGFGNFSEAYPPLKALDSKGLVWWEDGKVSLRRDALLQALGSTESNASGTPAWDAIGPRVAIARAAIAKATQP